MAFDLLQGLALVLLAHCQAVVCEENSLVEMVVDKVKGRHCIEFPAEHA